MPGAAASQGLREDGLQDRYPRPGSGLRQGLSMPLDCLGRLNSGASAQPEDFGSIFVLVPEPTLQRRY